jgi:hypothetical protein
VAAEKAAAGCTQRGDESISRTIGQGAAASAASVAAAGWGQEMGARASGTAAAALIRRLIIE